ncbi:MAG: (Na+)-NQR maturation NqrM [Litorivicinus sp.]
MSTMLLAFGLMALIMIGMAVGVIFGRQPISGSCGGAARLGIGGKCSLCGDDPSQCESTEDSKSVVPVKRKASFTDAARH